jgi:hypothetical protein
MRISEEFSDWLDGEGFIAEVSPSFDVLNIAKKFGGRVFKMSISIEALEMGFADIEALKHVITDSISRDLAGDPADSIEEALANRHKRD